MESTYSIAYESLFIYKESDVSYCVTFNLFPQTQGLHKQSFQRDIMKITKNM